jgi:hypothetical protein
VKAPGFWRFQPLHLKCNILVSQSSLFTNFNVCRYAADMPLPVMYTLGAIAVLGLLPVPEMVGLSAHGIQLTHSLKATGFNP